MSKRMRFVIKKNIAGQYFWEFKSANGEIICVTESYIRKESAKHSIGLLMKFASTASVIDLTE